MCGKMHRSDFLLGVIAVFLTLEEMKNYLRVDHEEDDGLLADLLKASERLCMDIARMENQQELNRVRMPRLLCNMQLLISMNTGKKQTTMHLY